MALPAMSRRGVCSLDGRHRLGCSPELTRTAPAQIQSFFGRFTTYFPELEARHPKPQQFAEFVFASLRDMGMLDLFEVSQEEVDGQLDVLVQVIVQAGTARA